MAKMTRADYVRNLDDVALAKLFLRNICQACRLHETCSSELRNKCYSNILRGLKEEIEVKEK